MKKTGFTLIEIAIVLVIIGLLAGGILKGQQMIENAKFKKLLAQISEVQVAVNTFRDRYKYYPGDFPRATQAFAGATGVTIKDGDGNGRVEGGYCENAPDLVESCMLWQHLRLAGLISGDPGLTGLTKCPTHVFGGTISAVTTRWRRGIGYIGGHELYIMNLPGAMAERLDQELDDGKPNTGNILSNLYDTTTSYDHTAVYNMWVTI